MSEGVEALANNPVRPGRLRRGPREIHFGLCVSPDIRPDSVERAPRNDGPLPATTVIRNYDDLLLCLRQRANDLQISRETIDHISGLPSGLSAKIMSLNKLRRIGVETLGPLLDVLALRLVAIPDDEAFARNRSRYVRRSHPHFRSASAKSKKTSFVKVSGPITARLFGWPVPET
jgi:hypothetical protein